MSEYARAALRLLTPFRPSHDKKGPIQASSQEPAVSLPPKSDKVSLEQKTGPKNFAFMAGRPLFRIQEHIAASQGETNMSQLTMSQLSSSNDSNPNNPIRNQRVPSFPMPASLQSQIRKSNSTLHRHNHGDSFPMMEPSHVHRPEIADSNRFISEPNRVVYSDPNHKMYTETPSHRALYPVKQEEALAVNNSYHEKSRPMSSLVPTIASHSSMYAPYHSGSVQDRLVSHPSSISHTSKKRSWMETCLDTLKTPYRKRRNLFSVTQDDSKPELKMTSSVPMVECALTTPSSSSVAMTMVESVRDTCTSRMQGIQNAATRSEPNVHNVIADDIQRRHVDFMNELQKTREQICANLQAQYNDHVMSLEKEALQYNKTAVDQYQTRCNELSNAVQTTLNENIKVSEEKMNSFVMERISLEMEKWSASLEWNPMIQNMMEQKLSQALASHYAQADEKIQILEKKLLSFTETLQHPNTVAASVPVAGVEVIPSLTHWSAPQTQKALEVPLAYAHVEEKEDELDHTEKKRKENLVPNKSSLRRSNGVSQDPKVVSKTIPSSLHTPSTTPPGTQKKRSSAKASSPKKLVKSHNEANAKTIPTMKKAQYITPLVSQDPIRKRKKIDVKKTPTFATLPSPKIVFKSDGHDPEPIKSTNVVSNYQTTGGNKRKRNKDKVYGKKAKTFDFDSFDFL